MHRYKCTDMHKKRTRILLVNLLHTLAKFLKVPLPQKRQCRKNIWNTVMCPKCVQYQVFGKQVGGPGWKRISSTTESPPHKTCHTSKLPVVLMDRAGRRGRKKNNSKERREWIQWIIHFFRHGLPKICSISPAQIEVEKWCHVIQQ